MRSRLAWLILLPWTAVGCGGSPLPGATPPAPLAVAGSQPEATPAPTGAAALGADDKFSGLGNRSDPPARAEPPAKPPAPAKANLPPLPAMKPVAARPPAASVEPPALAVENGGLAADFQAYLDGLEALEKAKWADAVAAFGRAVEAEPDSAAYVRGRGIAYVLAEQFASAIKDLERVQKLAIGDKEGRIWLAVALQMSGNDYKARETFSEASHDPYENFLGKMRVDYWKVMQFRQTAATPGGRMTPEMQREGDNARASSRAQFPQAGAWYASRMKNNPDMAKALYRRAKQRFVKNDWTGALADLEFVRTQFPREAAVAYYHAGCLLQLGDAATARVELTQVLTAFTAFAKGYAMRALAAAKLGDVTTARADLDTAARISARDADAIRPAVEQVLAGAKAAASDRSPAELFAALKQAAQANAPLDKLVEQALALRRAVLFQRISEDEIYQQRKRALEDAVRASPGDPGKKIDLSEFLAREAKRRFERTLPQDQFRLVREEIPRDPDGEFGRAEALADEVLTSHPDYPRALVAKARVRFEYHYYSDADALLSRAVAIQEDVPDGLELWARVITIAAAQAEETAENLEQYKFGIDHWGSTTVYWSRSPSQAELAQARAYRAYAREKLAQARKVFERAVQLRPTDGQGWYDLGVAKLQEGDQAGARQALEKAVQVAPNLLQAHQLLAQVYRGLGMKAEAAQEASAAVNLLEVDTGYLLREAWSHMARTAWATGEKALDRAEKLDPSDARVAAYRGVVQTAREKPAESLVWYSIALAQEEARARLLGTTFGKGGTGRRPAEDVGLCMLLRLRIGALLIDARKFDEALPLFADNAALEPRIAVTDLLRYLPLTLLPDANPNPDQRPQPEHAASLLAWSHYRTGQVLVALRRTAEALPYLRAANGMASQLTNGEPKRPLNEPRNRAGLLLARLLLEAGQVLEAREVLQHTDTIINWANSKELFDEKRRLEQILFRMQQR